MDGICLGDSFFALPPYLGSLDVTLVLATPPFQLQKPTAKSTRYYCVRGRLASAAVAAGALRFWRFTRTR
jgi:hypothetical protein